MSREIPHYVNSRPSEPSLCVTGALAFVGLTSLLLATPGATALSAELPALSALQLVTSFQQDALPGLPDWQIGILKTLSHH